MLLTPLYTAPLPAGFQSGTVEIKSPGTYVDQAGRLQQPSYRFAINADGSLTNLQAGGATSVVGMGVGDRLAAPLVDVVIELYVAGSAPLRSTYAMSPADSGSGTLKLQQEKQAAPTVITQAQQIALQALAAQALINTQAATAATLQVNDALDLSSFTVALVPVALNQMNQALSSGLASVSAATGTTAYAGGDHTTLPAALGLYRIVGSSAAALVEAGQIWERTAGGVARRSELEAVSTASLAKRVAVSVLDFGAKGDGTTDDTAAIQAALNTVIPLHGRLFFPAGTYRISAALNVGADNQNNTGYRLEGESRGSTTIFQATAGLNVLNILGLYAHSFEISHLTFDAVASSGGGAVFFDHDPTTTGGSLGTHYNFNIHHCTVTNGLKRGFYGNPARQFPVWGCYFENIVMSNRGACFLFTPNPAVGQPLIHLNHVYISYNGTVEETQIQIGSAETVRLSCVEFNGGQYTSTIRQMELGTCYAVILDTCKSETATVNYAAGDSAALWSFPNSQVTAKNVSIIGYYINGSNSFMTGLSAGINGTLTVDGMNFGVAAGLGTGCRAIMADATTFLYALNLRLDPAVLLVPAGRPTPLLNSNTFQPTGLTSRGDVSVTLTSADTRTQYFNTALTANRSIVLPNSAVFAGMEFTIVRRGAGNFTLNVVDPLSGKASYVAQNQGVTWRAASAGEWLPVAQPMWPQSTVTAVRGDANVVLTAGDSMTQYFNSALTANRTITLPGSGVVDGMEFLILYRSSGGFTLTVADPLSAKNTVLTQNQSVSYVANGTGEWVPFALPAAAYTPPQPSGVTYLADANAALTAASTMNQTMPSAMTATRTVTLPSSGVFAGMAFTVTRLRASNDTFTLTVADPLSGKNTNLSPGQSVTYVARGSGEWVNVTMPNAPMNYGFIGLTDANYAVLPTDPRTHFTSGALTAARLITLPSTGVFPDLEFTFSNFSTGGFTQTVVDPFAARNTVLSFGQSVTYRSLTGGEWIPVAKS